MLLVRPHRRASSSRLPSRLTSIKVLDTICRSSVYLTYKLRNQLVHNMQTQDYLNSTFSALADPTRRAILARLASGDASVSELAQPFSMSMPAISKHLKVLEKAGLITRGRDAQSRPCHLQAEPLKNASAWIDHYRVFWEQSLDRLEKYLNEIQVKDNK